MNEITSLKRSKRGSKLDKITKITTITIKIPNKIRLFRSFEGTLIL